MYIYFIKVFKDGYRGLLLVQRDYFQIPNKDNILRITIGIVRIAEDFYVIRIVKNQVVVKRKGFKTVKRKGNL